MKLNIVVKTVLLCSVSYYFIYRLKLQYFSINLSFSNKNSLFLLLNFVLLLTLIIHKFCSTYVTNDDHLNEELLPYQADDAIIQGEVPNNYSTNNELVEEKYIILVEKFAKEEHHVGEKEEEITILDIVSSKEADTGWRHNLIQKPVQRMDLVVVEDLAPKVKEIGCVDEKLYKLDLDDVNRKYEEFIRIQRRKWQLDAKKAQLQLIRI